MKRLCSASVFLVALGSVAALACGQVASPPPAPAASTPNQAAPTGESATLQPKWVKGSEARYHFVIEATQTTTRTHTPTDKEKEGDKNTPPPAPTTSTQTQRFIQDTRLLRRVVDTGPEGTKLELVYESAKVAITTGNEAISYDSEHPEDQMDQDRHDLLAGPVKATIGTPITVFLDDKNNITRIERPDKLEKNGQQIAAGLVGDDMVRNTLAVLFGLPQAPSMAHAGQAWTSELKSPSPPIGTIVVNNTNTIESVQNGQATITTKGAVQLIPAVGPSAIPSKLLKSDVSGTMVWDGTAGTVASLQAAETIAIEGTSGPNTITVSNTVNKVLTRIDGGKKSDSVTR